MVLCCTSKIFHQSAFSCFYPPLSFYWSTLFLLKKCKKWVIYLQNNFRSQKNKQHIVEKDLLPLDSITRTISDEICNIWLREFAKYLQMILKDHKNSKGKETKALSIFQYSVSGWLATLLVSEVDTLFRMSNVLVCMCSRVIQRISCKLIVSFFHFSFLISSSWEIRYKPVECVMKFLFFFFFFSPFF